ncbi:MAG: NosD domain-containing protein [Candidatus Thorarchaeota archaeon]
MAHRDRVSRCVLSLTLFMFLLALAANVTPVTVLDGTAHQSTTVVSEPERRGMLVAGTPHGPIAIDGDANFSDTALLEGWPGDGSPENPYIIDGLDIDLGGGVGNCISISNTRVSFTISNCNLTGAGFHTGMDVGAGIFLKNVTNGELVNNTCFSNGECGISLRRSTSNTVSDNICNNNRVGIALWTWYERTAYNNILFNNTCTLNGESGIELWNSNSNTLANNTCTSNGEYGIRLSFSYSNIVANNTCNNNRIGIYLYDSTQNTVVDNTCNNNEDAGIHLIRSDDNTMANNTCTSNMYGIYLYDSDHNTVASNTCTSSRYGIYLHDNSTYNTVVNNTCLINRIGIFLNSSDSNTVVNNTCLINRIGIFLNISDSNTVVNNTCTSNMYGIYLDDSDSNTVASNSIFGIYLDAVGSRVLQVLQIVSIMCIYTTAIGIFAMTIVTLQKPLDRLDKIWDRRGRRIVQAFLSRLRESRWDIFRRKKESDISIVRVSVAYTLLSRLRESRWNIFRRKEESD